MELAVSSHFVLCTHAVILFKNSITLPCALAHPLHLLYLLASQEGILGSCWDHCVSWGKMDNVRENIPNYLSHCNGYGDKVVRRFQLINETIVPNTLSRHVDFVFLERDNNKCRDAVVYSSL